MKTKFALVVSAALFSFAPHAASAASFTLTNSQLSAIVAEHVKINTDSVSMFTAYQQIGEATGNDYWLQSQAYFASNNVLADENALLALYQADNFPTEIITQQQSLVADMKVLVANNAAVYEGMFYDINQHAVIYEGQIVDRYMGAYESQHLLLSDMIGMKRLLLDDGLPTPIVNRVSSTINTFEASVGWTRRITQIPGL